MSLPISPHRMTSLDSTPSLSSMNSSSTTRKEQAASVLIGTPLNVDDEVEDITMPAEAEKEASSNQHNLSEDQNYIAEKPISYKEEEEAVPVSTIKPLSLIEENNNSSSMVSFQDFLTLKKSQKQNGDGTLHSSPIVSPRTLAAVKKELDSSRVEILEPEEFLGPSSPKNTSFRKQSNMLQEISNGSIMEESEDDDDEPIEDIDLLAPEEELLSDSETSELLYAVPYEASPDNVVPLKKVKSFERNTSFAETMPYEITIQYERTSKAFKPGETVKGYVKLKNTIKMEMSQAIITLLGKESLFYPQLSVEENIITQLETRFGRSIFNKGAHMLEFSFVLPENIEPSIVKNFATIGYTINASVQCLVQNGDGDFEEQYLSCISSFSVKLKDYISMQSLNYSYDESPCQCNIGLTRNVFIPEDVIEFTLDIKDCALDVKSKEIIIKVVERTSYRSLLDDFKEQDNNVIVFYTLTDCHTENQVSKTIQVILPSDISESTRGLSKMMTVSHVIEIEFFGEGGISVPFFVVSSLVDKPLDEELSPIAINEVDAFEPPTPLAMMKNILSTPSHLFPNISPIGTEKKHSPLIATPSFVKQSPKMEFPPSTEKKNINNSIAAMFSQYNPNSPTHQAYINYKIDYHNQPHDTIMVTPMPTLEKGHNSTLLNESDIDGINKQIEKTRKHVDELNGMLKESSVPFNTNDDFWCKYSPQIPLEKLIVEEIDEGDLPELEAPFQTQEEQPLERGIEPALEQTENHRSALNNSRSSLNKSALQTRNESYDTTESFEIEGEGIYTGQHIDYIPNGVGTLTSYNGNVITCNFVDGKANGTGSQLFKDGSMYKGTFVSGLKHGKGVIKTSSYKYKGEWRDDKKEGNGIILYSNSESYEGEFSNNFPHGKGRYIFKDQSVYEGEFIEGKRHGLGALYYSDGVTIYEGTWERDRKIGQAKIILSNGIYEGSIVNDVKEGYGVYSYKNGDVYEGCWKQDKKHGEGIYYFANGGYFKGKWDYSKKHGRGIISTSDGTNYEEIWSMDKLISKKRLPIFLNPNLL